MRASDPAAAFKIPSGGAALAGKVYVWLVVLTGCGLLGYAVYRVLLSDSSAWLFLAALAAVASFFPIKIPISRNGTSSVGFGLGDILIFTAILLFDWEAAVCLAAIEALSTALKTVKSVPKAAFNLAQLSLTSFFTAHFFYFLHPMDGPLQHDQITNPALLLLQVGLCGLVYFGFNFGFLSLAIALTTRTPWTGLWHSFKWSAISHVACGCLGAIIFLYFGASEFYYLVLAAPMVALVLYTFKVNQARINQAHKHLEEVQALLAEKILAEKELQKAKDSLETRVEQRTRDLRSANQRLRVEVNERKAAQRALAAETERLRVTLRSIGDGVVTTDTEGRVALLNEVAETLTGWRQKQARGKPLGEVFKIVNLSDKSPCADLCQRVIATGEISALDGQDRAIVARDGSERVISHSAAPIRDDDGLITGVVMVFRDITEERRLERELLKAQKLESLGILAGGIAHDFNNILSGILLKTQLAQRALTKQRDPSKHLVSVQEAVQTATTLTQQLLTFARGGAPIKQAASIGEVVKESASFALRGSQVRCQLEIPDDLHSAEIDRGQISQVIHNLVINAAQAMPNGGTISIEAENCRVGAGHSVDGLPPGDYARVTVADQGCGIPDKYLANIFDPYFSTKPTGHGLGLTTTHSIIKRHGGRIEVDSEIDKGSRFTFYLPASQAKVQGKPREEEISFADGDGEPGRVLIMDDERQIRESLGEVLDELGYEVGHSGDGAQALKVYREAMEAGHPFDVVIMDLTIPGGMGGREAIGRLLALDPDAKAVVYSGYSKDPVMAAYRDHGFRAMLSKPFKFQQLAGILKELIAQGRQEKSSPAGAAAVGARGESEGRVRAAS